MSTPCRKPGLEGYRDAPDKALAFQTLARNLTYAKKAGQLKALIAVHRQAYPDDHELVVWDLEARWLNKDYDGALQLLTDHRDDVFAQQRHQWKADNYRVRCLVKLKRTKEAIEAADTVVKKKYGNQLLLILAYAAAGDVKKTIAVLEEPQHRVTCWIIAIETRIWDQSCRRGGVQGIPGEVSGGEGEGESRAVVECPHKATGKLDTGPILPIITMWGQDGGTGYLRKEGRDNGTMASMQDYAWDVRR